MRYKAIIYGAGCQGRAVQDILETRDDVELVGFVDDNPDNREKEFFGKPILGGYDQLKDLVLKGEVNAGISGIGGYSRFRRLIFERLSELEIEILNAIHPSSIISKNLNIGRGNFIGAGAVIGPDCIIGDDTIINNCSCLTIDITVRDHVNVTPGVNFAAGIVVGEESYIGIGANVKQYLNIGRRAIVAGSSMVLENVGDDEVVAGVPAKLKKKRED